MSREAATEEINEWLEYKRIRGKRLEDLDDNIEVLVEAMVYGDLVKDGNELVQKLVEPIGGAGGAIATEKLVYKPRIKQSQIMNIQNQNKIKTTDHQGLMACYVCAITGESFGIIKSMATEDWRVAQSIVLFFT